MGTSMVEVRVCELISPALDWAVGVAEGNPMRVPVSDVVWSDHHGSYAPSISWAQCGPLMDTHAVKVSICQKEQGEGRASASVARNGNVYWQGGSTPLIAICRAVVAASLGEAVRVPAELVCLHE